MHESIIHSLPPSLSLRHNLSQLLLSFLMVVLVYMHSFMRDSSIKLEKKREGQSSEADLDGGSIDWPQHFCVGEKRRKRIPEDISLFRSILCTI